MQELKNSYRSSIIILLFLIRLGSFQHAYGKGTSSTTEDLLSDKEAVKFLKELSERKGPGIAASPKYNITPEADLHDIVTARFMKEMTKLFFWLPELDQCKILSDVSKTTLCSVSDIVERLYNLTEIKHNVTVSCPVDEPMKFKTCSHTNRSKMVSIFGNELLKVFATLPSPFKCHVVNTIALFYHRKGRRHLANRYSSLTLTVSEAQNQIEQIYPSVSLPQTCADLEMNHLIPSIPPINITVNLSNGDKTAWLLSLSRKGPDIYRTAMEYERETYHKGKVLGHGSTKQFLAENKELIEGTQFVVVGVHGGRKIFSVLFRLKVKRKQSNRLREIRSTYKIVQALAAKDQQGLKAIFNATIIAVSLSGERSNINNSLPKEHKWTLHQLNTAKDLFPVHLSEYYKQLGKLARCFVVYFISIKLKKSPKEVEMFYIPFGRFSRKHTCYYTRRAVPTDTPKLTVKVISHEIFQNMSKATRAPTVTVKTGIPSKGSDSAMDRISEKVVSEDLPTLEIALFTLLGVLCIAVLAFTVNCVVSALKAKPTYQNNAAPKGTIQTAVFLKGTNTAATLNNSGNDSVHFTEGISRNGGNFQPSDSKQLPKREYNITGSKLSNLYVAPQSHHIVGCDDKRTFPKSSQAFHDSGGKHISTNTRTHKENEYCLDSSSQSHQTDNAVMESPWKKRFPCKTACQRKRKEVLDPSVRGNDRGLESQGKASCSISDTNCKALPHRTAQPGSPPLEEVHEMVVVLLNCKDMKEEQV